jgi:IS30 family transposase
MFADRADIAVGIRCGRRAGRSVRTSAGTTPSWRERRRNSTKTHGYRPVTADVRAEWRRKRPQVCKVDADPVLKARVMADLMYSRSPRPIAGRLPLEATDHTVDHGEIPRC